MRWSGARLGTAANSPAVIKRSTRAVAVGGAIGRAQLMSIVARTITGAVYHNRHVTWNGWAVEDTILLVGLPSMFK